VEFVVSPFLCLFTFWSNFRKVVCGFGVLTYAVLGSCFWHSHVWCSGFLFLAFGVYYYVFCFSILGSGVLAFSCFFFWRIGPFFLLSSWVLAKYSQFMEVLPTDLDCISVCLLNFLLLLGLLSRHLVLHCLQVAKHTFSIA
jgi:hypothetical protein